MVRQIPKVGAVRGNVVANNAVPAVNPTNPGGFAPSGVQKLDELKALAQRTPHGQRLCLESDTARWLTAIASKYQKALREVRQACKDGDQYANPPKVIVDIVDEVLNAKEWGGVPTDESGD